MAELSRVQHQPLDYIFVILILLSNNSNVDSGRNKTPSTKQRRDIHHAYCYKTRSQSYFPISLVPQSTIKITGDLKHQKPVRIRRPQVLWTKHCHTCRPSLLNQTSARYIEIDTRLKTNLGCGSSQKEKKFLSRVELPADCQCENRRVTFPPFNL